MRRLLLLQLLGTRYAGGSGPRHADFVSLNTSSTAFTFNASSGSLASIVHLGAGGLNFLTAEQQPLFSLALTRPGNHGGPLQLHALEFRHVQSVVATRGYTWIYTDHPGAFGCDGHCLALSINCTVITSAEDGLLHFQIAVNRTEPAHAGSWAVQGLTYPGHEQRAVLDGPNDALLHPCGEGTLLRSPGAQVHSVGSSGYWSGPGMVHGRLEACAAVQFGARMTDRIGLYLASQDAGGAQKQWILHTNPGNCTRVAQAQGACSPGYVRWQLQHMVAEVPGANVTVAYDTVLGTFGSGGWRTAADLYKTWAKTQPWTSKLLSERTDIPEILLRGSPGIIAGIQDAQGYSGSNLFGPNLEKLPAWLDAYKAQVQTKQKPNLIFIPYGWENRGTWAGINCE